MNCPVQSRPFDLDQVNKQLLGLSGENISSTQNGRQPLRQERAPAEYPQGIEYDLEEERLNHDELINDGGRPWYPISLIKDVSVNPYKYYDMLKFWEPIKGRWDVFGPQLGRWEDFRIWQRDHRGINDTESEFAANIEWRKRLYGKLGDNWQLSRLGNGKLAEEFELWKEVREWRRETIRERHGSGGFHGYVKAVKKRLARHRFTREFELDRDPTRQDMLTTWIEYLNYEYWHYDQYMSEVERLRPRYDQAWKELVDSNTLRPYEREEYILKNFEHGFRQETEERAAWRVVEAAESDVKTASMLTEQAGRNPQHPNIPQQAHMRMLAAAQSRLDKANKSFALIKERFDHITVFHEKIGHYKIEKENRDNHGILLRWILKQITMIEAEMNGSKVAGGTSVDTRGRKRRSRRDQDGTTTEDQNVNSGADVKASNANISRPRVRRSARIAARQIRQSTFSTRKRRPLGSVNLS